MDAKRKLKLSIKGPVYKQVGSLSRGLKISHLYKRDVSGRVTLLLGTELRPARSNKRQQNEEAFFQKYSRRVRLFLMFSSFPCQFLFSRGRSCLRYTVGNFNKNLSMLEHLQKFCEHEQASTHLIFASNLSKGQILRALSN